MGEPAVSLKPADSETQLGSELMKPGWSQFSLYAPDRPAPDSSARTQVQRQEESVAEESEKLAEIQAKSIAAPPAPANPAPPPSFTPTVPQRPSATWMWPQASPQPASPEAQPDSETKPSESGWLKFDFYAAGQAPPNPLREAGVQAKLSIEQPNDVYEQEADQVAEQVMGMSSAATPTVQRQAEEEELEEIQTKPLAETITPLVQRQEDVEEDEPIQAKCEDCEAEEPIQRFSDRTAQAQPDLENRLNSSKSGGSALSEEVRSFMEPRFGADFSQVRVHTGSDAVQMNQELNAQAFAHKQDVYFGAGKAPGNDALTAHELTHVVQQTRGIGGETHIHRTPTAAKTPIEEAKDLISKHTTLGLIIDQTAIANTLIGQLPGNETVTLEVLNQIRSDKKDDVAYEIAWRSGGKLGSLSQDLRFRLITELLDGIVTDAEEAVVASIWISFDKAGDYAGLAVAAKQKDTLWQKSLKESDDLVKYVKRIVDDFKQDVKDIALHHLDENQNIVTQESGRYGINLKAHYSLNPEDQGLAPQAARRLSGTNETYGRFCGSDQAAS